MKIYVRYPIADLDMFNLLQKYPFLRKRFTDYRDDPTLCYNTDKEDIRVNWYKAWDGTGWERLWKIYFMPRLFKVYDAWEEEQKKSFQIIDTKSKFGRLVLHCSCRLPDDMEWILEWMSEYICENCGSELKDENGRQYIYTTKGWIANLCEDCLKGLIHEGENPEDLKHYADAFGYRHWVDNGFITVKYRYNQEHDWLEKSETIFDKEQQNEH